MCSVYSHRDGTTTVCSIMTVIETIPTEYIVSLHINISKVLVRSLYIRS